jgi:2-amino-4-hydroxy-6-hydroxymethyldihydropteridine diphosphokinase
MPRVYLSLGSNLGDRDAHLRRAIEALDGVEIRVTKVSPVYETEPVDFRDQAWFLNLAVEAETALAPEELLARIVEIERELGRVRGVPKGPRTADIDILFYGGEVIRTPVLEVPHPRIAERRFVLAPLADLAPEFRHPVTGRSVREMLEHAPADVVRLRATGCR